MPIHKVSGGWQWGSHGKVYPTRAGAERQMKAIFASGYKGRNPGHKYEASFHQAYLSEDFGRQLAMRKFSLTEEDLEKIVGRYVKGKHKGQLKGLLTWMRVDKGSWVRAGTYEAYYGASGYVTYPNQTYRYVIIDAWTRGHLYGDEKEMPKALRDYSKNPTLTVPIKSQEQLSHLFKAEEHLGKAGVHFDIGSSIKNRKPVTRDWELDWSLEGAKMRNPIVVTSEIAKYINSNIRAPYVHTQISTLGGLSNASIIITVSLDEKSTWFNNILQNSRYFMIHLSSDGTMDMFSKSYKLSRMRKSKVISPEIVVLKINSYISSVNESKIRNPIKSITKPKTNPLLIYLLGGSLIYWLWKKNNL